MKPDATDTDLAAIRHVVVSRDGEECILGRPDLSAYVVVPEPGAILVESLQSGQPLASAARRASEAAGAEVDADDFLASLAAAGLLDPPPVPSGQPDVTGPPGRRTREVRWIAGVRPEVAKRLFGPIAWSGYAAAAAVVAVVVATRADLRPTFEHLWWLPDPVLSILLLIPLGLGLNALHEAWHWLAGRAIGVPAVFRVSYRGAFLVFETDLSQIVSMPRRQRYGPFLAGMAFDVTVLAAALLLRVCHRADMITLPPWLDRLLAAIVLMLLLGVLWQWAALFLRSDGYAVLANAFRCHNLYRATWLTTKDRLWGLSGAEAGELSQISGRDRRVARWFGLLYLAGLVAMAWMLIAYVLPFTISMVGWVGHSLVSPLPTSVAFWEAVGVVGLLVGRFAVVPLLVWRERRLRRAGVLS